MLHEHLSKQASELDVSPGPTNAQHKHSVLQTWAGPSRFEYGLAVRSPVQYLVVFHRTRVGEKHRFRSAQTCQRMTQLFRGLPELPLGRADDGDACGEVGEHVSLQAALDQ